MRKLLIIHVLPQFSVFNCRLLSIFILNFFFCVSFVPKAKAIIFWASPDDYQCDVVTDSVNLGNIYDSQVSGQFFSDISANCTIKRSNITGFVYCLAVRGSMNTVGGSFYRYISEGTRNGKLYLNFYDAVNTTVPIGEKFEGSGGFLHGFFVAAGNGSFRKKIPIMIKTFNNRVVGGDGSIIRGNYHGFFNLELRYAAVLNGTGGDDVIKAGSDCLKLPHDPASGSKIVQANVVGVCSIGVIGDINFGAMPNFELLQGRSAVGEVEARCSSNVKYQIGLAEGLHKNKAVAGYRAMQRSANDGSGDFIAYNLYQDSGYSLPWTVQWGTQNVKKGAGTKATKYTIYGFVPPQKERKNAGFYRDIVRVEIRVDAG